MALKRELLIVEDNEINREMLGEILCADYRVLKAENGQVALEVLKAHKSTVSLILLDVRMPVMDGYTFLDRIKQDPTLSLIPVIVMTQSSSMEDELAALAHGATDFVPKPYRPQVILHRVAALIKLRETAAMVNELQYDRLTGLYSKEFFYQKVRQQLLEDPDGEYCIIGSNVENFKLINDIFGTQEGDRLLKEIADMLLAAVGDSGFCGRFSADRFLIFMNRELETRDREHFRELALKEMSDLRKNIIQRWGIYQIRNRSVPVEHMCDRALLAADSIKNQYNRYFAVYDDSLRNKLLREQAITTAMETALEEEQFVVYLQPKFSLRDNRMAGAEALVRWIHPEWGFMSPGEFVPLFEKNGFIPKLDQFIREKVCALLRDWKEKGYPMLPISVNISRADVFRCDLEKIIPELTRKYGVDPKYLHLELTESAYTENPEKIVTTIEQLRRQGYVVEMDDFGSGYSSLNMLSQLRLDVLKLDMKFVQNEIAKPASQSILGEIIGLAHRAHMEVVAEGVETREQMNRLRSEECDFVQGFFCAKPMPVAEYEKLLREWEPGEDTSGAPHDPAAPQKNCLLVVDDDEAYRKLVAENFARYQVMEAPNASAALEYITASRATDISAVIVSMTLPENGSEAVMNALRRNPAFWEVPILATIPGVECARDIPQAMEADDFLCKQHPMFDLQRRVQKLVDAAAMRRREIALTDAASHDPLTGLLNRRGLQDALSSLRGRDMPLALCLFDLDGLKVANDSYGHETGDRMIQVFADVLRRQSRLEDIKCRYGGDEFIVVFKRMGEEKTARKKAEAIIRAFRERVEKEGFCGACTVGVALCGLDEKPSSELIDRADRAMYRAKRENKGGCCVWKEEETPSCCR